MRVLVAVFVAAVAMFAASRAAAQAEGYLAIDGVTPSSGAQGSGWTAGNAGANDPSWLPIESYQLQTVPGSSPARTQVNITRTPDATSPALVRASVSGQTYPKGILDVPGPNSSQMVYETQNVKVTNYQVSGSGGSSQESFTLAYQGLEVIDKTSRPVINGQVVTIPTLKSSLAGSATGQTSNPRPAPTTRPTDQPLKSPLAK